MCQKDSSGGYHNLGRLGRTAFGYDISRDLYYISYTGCFAGECRLATGSPIQVLNLSQKLGETGRAGRDRCRDLMCRSCYRCSALAFDRGTCSPQRLSLDRPRLWIVLAAACGDDVFR